MRLLLLCGVPALLLLVLGSRSFRSHLESAAEGDHLQTIVSLGRRLGDLLHETQRERGASALFLSSKGTRFGSELKVQRSRTDAKLTALVEILDAKEAEFRSGPARSCGASARGSAACRARGHRSMRSPSASRRP